MIVLAALLVLAGGVLANMYPKYAALLGAKSPVAGGVDGTQVNVPVSFQSPAVANVQLNYNFLGPVKSLAPKPGIGAALTLNSSDLHVPTFNLTSATRILRVDAKNAQTPADQSDLKLGTVVDVVAYFDIRRGTWTTSYVFIRTPGPSTSASPKPSASPSK